jgi:hypothetical protein
MPTRSALRPRTLCRISALVGCLIAVAPTQAWDGEVRGKIYSIESVPGGNNADLRVILQGSPAMCASTTSPTYFAFINISDANFKGTSATLMMAYALNKTVFVFSNISNTAPVGYCRIGFVTVTD